MSENPFDTLIKCSYREKISLNGYKGDELKSALQKYIRRCMVEPAIYSAYEIELFTLSSSDKAKGEQTNLYHRLMVIFMEDCQSPQRWPYINNLLFDLLENRGLFGYSIQNDEDCKQRRERAQKLVNVIEALASSPHSRECSFLKYCYFGVFHQSPDIRALVFEQFPFLLHIQENLEKDESYSLDIEFPSFRKKYESIPGWKQLDEQTEKPIREWVKNMMYHLLKKNDLSIGFAHKISKGFERMVNGDRKNILLPQRIHNKKMYAYLLFHVMELCMGDSYKPLISIAEKWYAEIQNMDEEFLTWQYMMLIYLRNIDIYDTIDTYDGPLPNKQKYLYNLLERNINGETIEFDEYVLDMHTREGKRLGRFEGYFADVSSQVCNETLNIDQKCKDAYLYGKRITEHMTRKKVENIKDKERDKVKDKTPYQIKEDSSHTDESEKAFFTLKTRVQLNTSDQKTDTYYAEKDGELVFVKGPLKATNAELSTFLAIQQMKKNLGLATIDFHVVYLKPDQFENIPMGWRKKIKPDQLYPFVYSTTLFNKGITLPTRIHSSVKWPPTEVLDPSLLEKDAKKYGWKHMSSEDIEEDEKLLDDYVKNVMFRYILGIGDFAHRNFLISQNRVYAIDEDDYFGDHLYKEGMEKLKKSLSERDYKQYEKYVRDPQNKKELNAFLDRLYEIYQQTLEKNAGVEKRWMDYKTSLGM